ncbi:hypothetical protein J6590_037415 [Homalodisca vitripennis]|nr:hypothetical protein J6590_037415 [Homalodisca vitripennis]
MVSIHFPSACHLAVFCHTHPTLRLICRCLYGIGRKQDCLLKTNGRAGFVLETLVAGFVLETLVGGFVLETLVGGFALETLVGGFVLETLVGGFVLETRDPIRHDRPCGRVMRQQYDSNTSATTITLHCNRNQCFSPVVSPCDTIAPVGE